MKTDYKVGDLIKIIFCQEASEGLHKCLNRKDVVKSTDKSGVYGSNFGYHYFQEIEPIEERPSEKLAKRFKQVDMKEVMTPEQVDEKVKEYLERAKNIASNVGINYEINMGRLIEIAKMIQREGDK